MDGLQKGAGKQMSDDYTFVLRDTDTGLARQLQLVCLTDADAMLIAHGIGGARDIQVWERDRLVGEVKPRPPRNGEIAA
jgi:hypothetical protein